jgi:hypothetical protein
MIAKNAENQARNAAAEATNAAYTENQELQTEAYNTDMENYWEQDIQSQKQLYQTAEDAAAAGLEQSIANSNKDAAWKMASLGGGGGGLSADRGLAVLKRQMATEAYDLDQRFQRGLIATKDEVRFREYDKVGRWHQAKGQIASMRMDPGVSTHQQYMNVGAAGAASYASTRGKGPAKPKTGYGKPPTHTPGTGVQ